MRRGEVRLVDFEPTRKGEVNRRRPAIVVSNEGANLSASRYREGVITVVPLTSSVARVHPFQVLLPAEHTGLDLDSKAQAEQVRSVAFSRVGPKMGMVAGPLMEQVDAALRLHIAL